MGGAAVASVSTFPAINKMHLYLDDLRPTPAHVWYDPAIPYTYSPKTAAEAIALLKTGEVEFISFDHDLGESESIVGNGCTVARWIEEQAYTNPDFTVPDWYVHSASPVGAGNIHRAMLSALRAPAPADRSDRRHSA